MFIEVTKLSGEPVTINVLQIEAVEGSKAEEVNNSLYSPSPSVLVTVNQAGYYVKESYHEIIEEMKKAMSGMGMNMPVALMR